MRKVRKPSFKPLQTATGSNVSISGEVGISIKLLEVQSSDSKFVKFNHTFLVADGVTGPILGIDI